MFSNIGNITVENLNKKFGKHQVLEKLNLVITKGEITTIFGPSGAGKSTLLNIIGLVESADSGVVKVFGKEIPNVNSREATGWRRNKLDYLFQNFGLIDDKTVKANLDISLVYKKLRKKDKLNQQIKALQDVGLDVNYLKMKVHDLSGGEQQRIAIAKTILKDADVILADEPTGSLDEENKKRIAELLVDLKNKGKTVVIVSHDRYFESISDKCVYIK